MRTLGKYSAVLISLFLASCGSSKDTSYATDPELEALFQGSDYKSLTDAARYDIAQYFLKHHDSTNGRAILEDIATYNSYVSSVKYQLARIYLLEETITFAAKTEKDEGGQIVRNGKELGESILKEILGESPDFMAAYSDLMMLALQRGDTTSFEDYYRQASEREKTFLASDYRIGYLTVQDRENPKSWDEGTQVFRKAKDTYLELYESYKNLGDIQRVQFLDTMAYRSYRKALEYPTEAYDLFLVYYHLSEVSARIYEARGDSRYRSEAVEYACRSLSLFPGYTPALSMIRRLANVQSAADSVKSPAEYASPFQSYCTAQHSDMKIQSVTTNPGAIPRSIYRETIRDKKSKK